MSLRGLLNQSITIYNKNSYDVYGRETVGSGTTLKARVQQTTKQKLMPNGSLKTIDLIVYVPSDTSINTDDRLDYLSTQYKVWGKYDAVDGQGNTNHIKLELVKWRLI